MYVYYASIEAKDETTNLLSKIERLWSLAKFDKIVKRDEFLALKVHFGEPGNTTFVNPLFVKKIVDCAVKTGAKIFLTDTNTLYIRSRHNAIDHIKVAYAHGFNTVGVPIIIADGLTGKDFVNVKISKKYFEYVKIGSALYHSDSILCISHFKGHLETGFGGALKNIGMGSGCRSGKQMMHSDVKPMVDETQCKGCGRCIRWCPSQAIKMTGNKKAEIDSNVCVGCGECVVTCPNRAIEINWRVMHGSTQERMVEFAYGVIKDKPDRVGFFNFLLNITPDCDCVSWSDTPIVNDIGILASTDPVAIDQASVDLVNAQIGVKRSRLKSGFDTGEDKFRGIWNIDWSLQLKYAEELGLGTRRYKLVGI